LCYQTCVESGDASGQQILNVMDQCIVTNGCYFAPDPETCITQYCTTEINSCLSDN
jgi:hypothetical protein